MARYSGGGASGRSWVTDRLQDDTGAQLLEFAVILPILLSLMFGIITGGVAFSQDLSIDNAARESARYAATLPVDGNLDGWLAQVADVSLGTATGTLDDGQPGREICVSYVYPDGSDTNDRTRRVIENEAGVRTFSSQPCLADGRPSDERRVQILLERDTDLIVFYFSKTLTLSGQSVARFERAS